MIQENIVPKVTSNESCNPHDLLNVCRYIYTRNLEWPTATPIEYI